MSVSTSQAGSDRRPGEFGTQVGAQLDPGFGSRGSRFRPVSKPKDTRTVLSHLGVYLRQQQLTLALVFAATLVSSLVAVFAPRLVGCVHRQHSATDSGNMRPPVTIIHGHRLR